MVHKIGVLEKKLEETGRQSYDKSFEIEKLKCEIEELNSDLQIRVERCKELEDAMRNMTSLNSDEMDDSFEAVIRSEFEMMIKNFEKKVTAANEQVLFLKAEVFRRVSEKDLELDKLKAQNESMSSRLMQLRL